VQNDGFWEYKLEGPTGKIRFAEIIMRTRVVVVDDVVVVVGVVVVCVVVSVVIGVFVAVAAAVVAFVKVRVDKEAAEFAPDDDNARRAPVVASVDVDAAPVVTDALSPALPGCKVDCGDIKISADNVVSVSSSALIVRLAGVGSLGWVIMTTVSGGTIDSLLPTTINFGVAVSKFPFVFPAELAVNFRVVSLFNAVDAADPTGFCFGFRFVVHKFLPQHLIIVLRLMPLFLPAAIEFCRY
jgi:hypothetical protein